LLIQHIQGGYCDKSCTNDFHGPPRNHFRGKDDEESGRN
jgi:hypothetical protein